MANLFATDLPHIDPELFDDMVNAVVSGVPVLPGIADLGADLDVELTNGDMLDSYHIDGPTHDRIRRLAGNGLKIRVVPEHGKIAAERKIVLRRKDAVIPICIEGMNRSQVMCTVLLYIQTIIECRVTKPHGARGGFDPYQAYADLSEDNWFGYCHSIIPDVAEPSAVIDRCFVEAFGIPKHERILQDKSRELNVRLNLDDMDSSAEEFRRLSRDRTVMRGVFDEEFYCPTILNSMHRTGGNTVVMCFADAFKLFLQRLEENASAECSLEGIVVVLIPWADTIAHPSEEVKSVLASRGVPEPTREQLLVEAHKAAFKQYASIFTMESM
jgi:hypothetical protein